MYVYEKPGTATAAPVIPPPFEWKDHQEDK